MTGQYIHLATRLFETPLLLDLGKARVIIRVIGPRLGVDTTGLEIGASSLEDPKARRPYQITQAGIACIDICGTLVNRATGMDAMSGLTSYTSIANEVLMAAEDPLVSGILLCVDSHGGEVAGAFTCADAIRQAAAVKPVWAAVDDCALSAGYLLACCANKVFVSKTGMAGSVGVIAIHVDQSAADLKAGLKFTVLSSGAHKADGNPHEALSPRVAESIQQSIDSTRQLFVEHVADCRGMKKSAVSGTEADIFDGAEAVSVGFADGVLNIREAMAAFEVFLGGDQTQMSVSKSAAMVAPKEQIQMQVDEKVVPATPAAAAAEQPSAPVAAPAPAPAQYANVTAINELRPALDVDAIRSDARAAGYSDATEIAELCHIAQRTDLIYGLLDRKVTAAQARKAIMEAQRTESQQAPIQNRVGNAAAPSGGNSDHRIDQMAKQVQARDGITYAQAYAKVMKENPQLYNDYLSDNPAQQYGTR